MPTHQDIQKKGSKILKLPSVRNCFTLAMTNKLVVIINSLKVPKMKKILLYEMKFLVPYYSCPQNPWLGDYCPQIPILSVLNWVCWNPPPTKQNSWVRHWLAMQYKRNNHIHRLHFSYLPATSVATSMFTSCFLNCVMTLFLSLWSMSPWSRRTSNSFSFRLLASSSAFAFQRNGKKENAYSMTCHRTFE